MKRIGNMDDPLRFKLYVTIRTAPRAKLAFDRVVAALRASERVKWKGGRVTQEAVFAAMMLWLEDLEDSFVEEVVATYLPRLEALMRGEDPGPTPPVVAANEFIPGESVEPVPSVPSRIIAGHRPAPIPQSDLKVTKPPKRPGTKKSRGA